MKKRDSIYFGGGLVFLDKPKEIFEFESGVGCRLPSEFWSSLGGSCGGFLDPTLSVSLDRSEIHWMTVVNMSYTTEDEVGCIDLINSNKLFFDGETIGWIPFGTSLFAYSGAMDFLEGWLAFSVSNLMIEFVPKDPALKFVHVANSFRELLEVAWEGENE